ncbi:MAG: response regulator transcription factor, partial [Blautia sp.]|nr:response regulator transcription factor [Blautia sp.]
NGIEFEIQVFGSADKLLLNYPENTDLIFMDIAMDGTDGMTAAGKIRKFDEHVCIIFITTMHHRAIEGYGVRAFGFIRKPVIKAELEHELTCALTQIGNNKEKGKFLTVKSEGTVYRLPISKIIYAEVSNHWIQLVHEDGVIEFRETIGELEKTLTPLGFFRCHSSYIVNGEKILMIEPMQLVMKNGSKIPISQRRRKDFIKEISVYLGSNI